MPEGGFDFRLPELHFGQKEVLRQQKEINFLCAGRGWRKTSLLLHLVKHYAFKRQEPVLWCSFTWDPITSVQGDQMDKLFGRDIWPNMYDATDDVLQPPGWEPIQFQSLEKDANARGKTPGLIIYDEMGQAPEGSFVSILSPMQFKSQGALWGAGTPNPADPRNDLWYYSTQLDAADYAEHMMGWCIPVVGAEYREGDIHRKPHPLENTDHTFEQLIKKWKECRTEDQRIRWRMEYLCEFLQTAGSQISDPRKVCIVPTVEGNFPNEWFAKGHRINPKGWYQKSADLAVNRDFLAIGVMDLETNRQVYMRHFVPQVLDTSRMSEQQIRNGQWEQIYRALKHTDDLFPGKFLVDTTGMGDNLPGTMSHRFGVNIEGINFSGKNVMKVALHDSLSSLIEGFRILLFDHEGLKKELEGLKRKESASGAILIGNDVLGKGKKTTKHDDLATMAALMCRGIEGEDDMRTDDLEKPTDNAIQIYESIYAHIEINPFSAYTQDGAIW